MILLDTHAALWLLKDDPALGKQSCRAALAARDANALAISAMSFWEAALLVAKGRLKLGISPAGLRRQLLGTGVVELPVSGDIAVLSVELQNLHGDPADRLIAATAIAHDATLMTADKQLLSWRHKVKRQNAAK